MSAQQMTVNPNNRKTNHCSNASHWWPLTLAKKMKNQSTNETRRSGCTATWVVFMALAVTATTALADFAEHTDVDGPQQATKALVQALAKLRPDGDLMSLTEVEADSILTVGTTSSGVLLSLNVSHFWMKGHGDTANEHEYLIDFPVRPPPNSSPVKNYSLPMNRIVPLLTKDFIRFKMVTHAMRRRDSKKLSWASSRLLIELKDSASAEKILPALIAIIYEANKASKYIVIPTRREDEP